MAKYTLTQVSVFYLLLIVVLAYLGFKYGMKLGSKLGIVVGDALGSALGAVLGVALSYFMFQYVRRNRMLK